jgi:hypothetical protein
MKKEHYEVMSKYLEYLSTVNAGFIRVNVFKNADALNVYLYYYPSAQVNFNCNACIFKMHNNIYKLMLKYENDLKSEELANQIVEIETVNYNNIPETEKINESIIEPEKRKRGRPKTKI